MHLLGLPGISLGKYTITVPYLPVPVLSKIDHEFHLCRASGGPGRVVWVGLCLVWRPHCCKWDGRKAGNAQSKHPSQDGTFCCSSIGGDDDHDSRSSEDLWLWVQR